MLCSPHPQRSLYLLQLLILWTRVVARHLHIKEGGRLYLLLVVTVVAHGWLHLPDGGRLSVSLCDCAWCCLEPFIHFDLDSWVHILLGLGEVLQCLDPLLVVLVCEVVTDGSRSRSASACGPLTFDEFLIDVLLLPFVGRDLSIGSWTRVLSVCILDGCLHTLQRGGQLFLGLFRFSLFIKRIKLEGVPVPLGNLVPQLHILNGFVNEYEDILEYVAWNSDILQEVESLSLRTICQVTHSLREIKEVGVLDLLLDWCQVWLGFHYGRESLNVVQANCNMTAKYVVTIRA